MKWLSFKGQLSAFQVKNSPCCGQPRCQFLGGHTPTKLIVEGYLPRNENTLANNEKSVCQSRAPLVALWESICLPVQETQIHSLLQREFLEKEMATHSSILTWEIPWTEEPSGLHFMGYQKNQTHTHESDTTQQLNNSSANKTNALHQRVMPAVLYLNFCLSHLDLHCGNYSNPQLIHTLNRCQNVYPA